MAPPSAPLSTPARRAEPSTSDRTNHHHRRSEAERLVDRAAYLERDADRLLIEQVCRYGRPLCEVAALQGLHARAVEREYQRLIKHLKHPAYVYLMTSSALLDPEVRRTAEARYFGRRTLRETARCRRRSLHEVRKHLTIVEALATA